MCSRRGLGSLPPHGRIQISRCCPSSSTSTVRSDFNGTIAVILVFLVARLLLENLENFCLLRCSKSRSVLRKAAAPKFLQPSHTRYGSIANRVTYRTSSSTRFRRGSFANRVRICSWSHESRPRSPPGHFVSVSEDLEQPTVPHPFHYHHKQLKNS